MSALSNFRDKLEPGHVYRRQDVSNFSKSVDRHLKQLLEEGTLIKPSQGIYYRPKKTSFGKSPSGEKDLITAFLKDGRRFLAFSWNMYNSLGVGTTQLYNETVVYNHKRHGLFKLGNRTYRFVTKHHFPETITEEFLLVDLVNNLSNLAEDREKVLNNVEVRARDMNEKLLKRAAQEYGGVRARKFFGKILKENLSCYDC